METKKYSTILPDNGWKIVQICWSVPDIEEACKKWQESFNVGPFFLYKHIQLKNARYRNAESSFDHSSAYAQWGDIMIELLHDHTQGPSPVSEIVTPNATGVHHTATFVENFKSATMELKSKGFEEVFYAETSSGSPFAFYDTRSLLGHFLEIYEPNENLKNFYQMVKDSKHDKAQRSQILQRKTLKGKIVWTR
tara:strand:+ start:393 stop:974 length:582 start_codon:yes stop_codon:yes gene_type:complete